MFLRLVHFGSNANNSGKAGSFTLNVNNGWTNANVNIGRHVCLLYFYQIRNINLTSW